MSRFDAIGKRSIGPPTKTANPIIIGTAQVGQTLTATHGSYSGFVSGYSGQWYSGASPISLATSLSYTIQNSDLGNSLTYQEAGTYRGFSSAIGTSNALGPVTSGGGGAGFDTRFGTATDTSTGWITFGLRPSVCRRIWVDSVNGNDTTGDGLTAATAYATIDKGATLYMGAGHTPGDQLMIAGGAGQAYTDTGNVGIFEKPGFSLLYPNAVLCYDSTDPSNASKYGRLTGTKMPVITHAYSGSLRGASSFTGNVNYMVVQGFRFVGPNDGTAAGVNLTNTVIGRAWQNTVWDHSWLEFVCNQTTDQTQWADTLHVSKSVGYGQWFTNGNAHWMFIQGTKNCYIEDVAGVHCGWKMGRTRATDTNADIVNGAAHNLAHGIYLGAENTGFVIRRTIGIDSAQDFHSLRGAWTGYCLNTIDEAVVGTVGGWSSASTESPSGVVITVHDWGAMGGCDINSSQPLGMGWGNRNTLVGSMIDNVAMYDNPNLGHVNNLFLSSNADNASGIGQALAISNVRTYNSFNYGGTSDMGALIQGPNANNVTFANCKTDFLLSGTGNSTWSGSPPGTPTRAATYAALGFTNDATQGKKDLANWLIAYPELIGPIAMALNTKILANLGLTPTTYPAATMPSLSGYASPPTIF